MRLPWRGHTLDAQGASTDDILAIVSLEDSNGRRQSGTGISAIYLSPNPSDSEVNYYVAKHIANLKPFVDKYTFFLDYVDGDFGIFRFVPRTDAQN